MIQKLISRFREFGKKEEKKEKLYPVKLILTDNLMPKFNEILKHKLGQAEGRYYRVLRENKKLKMKEKKKAIDIGGEMIKNEDKKAKRILKRGARWETHKGKTFSEWNVKASSYKGRYFGRFRCFVEHEGLWYFVFERNGRIFIKGGKPHHEDLLVNPESLSEQIEKLKSIRFRYKVDGEYVGAEYI